MWRSLVLASLMQSAPLGAERIERLASPDSIDALASSFTAPAPLSRALDQRLATLRSGGDARLADETLRVFSPLAERAGLGSLRSALDDASFSVLAPARYAPLAVGAERRAAVATQVASDTRALLTHLGHQGEVSYRSKSAYSTWRKMQRKGLAAHEVLDRVALRLIVDDEAVARTLLTEIHERYQPIEGSFDDYIAHPKANGYQSLHTAVHVQGETVEFQLRTWAMHEAAEQGDAAHWRYKLVG